MNWNCLIMLSLSNGSNGKCIIINNNIIKVYIFFNMNLGKLYNV